MKILVAEDDPVTRESVAACLLSEGFEVVEAENGAVALERWRVDKPDLVCLDVMMPERDGYSVCREIRRIDPAVSILFLSAKNEEIDVVVGLELGADDFVRKPFGKAELLARVRAALRRAAPTIPEREPLTFGEWQVFPKELRASRGDEDVDLTPREVKILALLHRRAKEAIHRDDLLDECWGLDYYPESRTLDQHISKLRRKLGDDPDDGGLIETVRGVGYRYRG